MKGDIVYMIQTRDTIFMQHQPDNTNGNDWFLFPFRYVYGWHFISFLVIFCLFLNPTCAAENQRVTCGVILPLSGELNISGTTLLQGIELATEEINADGGVSGHKIDLRITDDEGDPETALSHFKEMQEEGISVVIGSYSTDITQLMAEETKRNQTILISPRANGEVLYGISPFFYQVNAPVSYNARFVSDWLSYTSERVAIVYIDNEYGRSLLTGISSNVDRDSVLISGTEPVTSEMTDYSTLSHKLLDGAPDAVVVIMYDSRQIPMIRYLIEAGFRGQVVLTEAGRIETLEKEAAGDLSKFAFFTISANTNLVPGTQTEMFTETYKAKYNQDPTRTIAGYGYDTVMVLADAIRLGSDNGNISSQSIQKGLKKTRYFGVSGPKVFDSHNAVSAVLDRWVFRDGNFSLMTTSFP